MIGKEFVNSVPSDAATKSFRTHDRSVVFRSTLNDLATTLAAANDRRSAPLSHSSVCGSFTDSAVECERCELSLSGTP